jgi:hypothetical protein
VGHVERGSPMFTFGILQVVSMCNLYNPYQYIYVQRFYLAGLGRGTPYQKGEMFMKAQV